jgi:hypothetical protein
LSLICVRLMPIGPLPNVLLMPPSSISVTAVSVAAVPVVVAVRAGRECYRAK